MAIAPWLQPTDVLGAMSRGAGLGLQARAQDTQEEEAGDRLRLAYTQLASQEKRAAEQAKAMQDYRLAQLDLKTQQQAMLQDFREKNMARQIEASRESMDLRQKLAENTVKHQADLLALQKDKVATQLSPAVKAQQHVIDAKRRSLQAKVEKTDGCWNWIGGMHRNGSGSVGCGGHVAPMKANRMSWIMHYGDIPDGLFVLHKCDNRACVRPDHLFLGTQADNITDKVSKGRQFHKLTRDQVIEIRNRYPSTSMRQIAQEFGTTHQNVEYIISRKTWRHI